MTTYQVAREVLDGKWGNGEERKSNLINNGYDYYEVQKVVNAIIKGTYVVTEEDVKSETTDVVSIDEKTLVVEVDLSKYDKLVLELIT